MSSDQNLVELFALWENTDKNGGTYMTGRFGNARVVVFQNRNKKSDKHPDWRVLVGQNREEKRDDKEELPF